MNAFKIFGLEPCFELNFEELEALYKHQLEAHPDRFANIPWLRAEAQKRIEIFNDAYRKLKDPLYRAETVLRASKAWPASKVALLAFWSARCALETSPAQHPDAKHLLEDLGENLRLGLWDKAQATFLMLQFSLSYNQLTIQNRL